jgi:hypothetical protein
MPVILWTLQRHPQVPSQTEINSLTNHSAQLAGQSARSRQVKCSLAR